MDVQEIKTVLLTVLNDIKLRQDRINYLPIYLDGAIGRHLGQKAEEYSEAQKARGLARGAKRLANVVGRTVDGVQIVQAVVEKTATETLSDLYIALKKSRRKKSPAPAKQQTLL
jgi:hypothetical protein